MAEVAQEREREAVLRKWWQRGMITVNALDMINRALEEAGLARDPNGRAKVDKWITNEYQQRSTNSVFREVILPWAARNRNPPADDPHQWLQMPGPNRHSGLVEPAARLTGSAKRKRPEREVEETNSNTSFVARNLQASPHLNNSTGPSIDELVYLVGTVYQQVEQYRENDLREYEARRRSEKAAHEAKQKKLGAMEDALSQLAQHCARMKQREKSRRVFESLGLDGSEVSTHQTEEPPEMEPEPEPEPVTPVRSFTIPSLPRGSSQTIGRTEVADSVMGDVEDAPAEPNNFSEPAAQRNIPSETRRRIQAMQAANDTISKATKRSANQVRSPRSRISVPLSSLDSSRVSATIEPESIPPSRNSFIIPDPDKEDEEDDETFDESTQEESEIPAEMDSHGDWVVPIAWNRPKRKAANVGDYYDMHRYGFVAGEENSQPGQPTTTLRTRRREAEQSDTESYRPTPISEALPRRREMSIELGMEIDQPEIQVVVPLTRTPGRLPKSKVTPGKVTQPFTVPINGVVIPVTPSKRNKAAKKG